MSALPAGWRSVNVRQLLGRTTNVDPAKSPATRFELWSVPSFSEGQPDSPLGTEVRSSKQIVQEGDVLLCKIVPHINRVWTVWKARGCPQIASGEWIVFREHGCEPHYLRYCLSAPDFREEFLKTVSGVGGSLMRARPSAVAEIEVPIPPLAEQLRIVAKLDALTARTARARAGLDRIPALAARYRQAVLARAFSGELIPARSVEDDVVDGPRDQQELSLDDQERGAWSVDSLPEGWGWRSFAAIFDDVTDSRRKLPTKEYRSSGRFPIVDQGEVAVPGFTDREDMVNLSAPPNIVFGDHTRCVKFVAERFAQGADGVKVLKPRPTIDPHYAALLLRAVEIPNKGYSRHMKFLRASYFPVCGLSMQREIVGRVDRAFAEIDRLTAEAAAARRLLDRLDQAVLAKAFRGELVPQDPADEPASVLLDRIRAERAAAPKAKRGRKTAA